MCLRDLTSSLAGDAEPQDSTPSVDLFFGIRLHATFLPWHAKLSSQPHIRQPAPHVT